MNIPRAAFWLAGAAVVAVVGVIVIPGVGRRLAFFRVRQVEVVGLHFLDPADVVARLNLPSGASIWDPLERVRKAAAAVPGVVEASVERQLPGTIRVTVREAVPVALTPVADRLTLVDYHGRVLPFDPTRVPTSLPVASRDAAIAALLGRLRLTDPQLYNVVESAYRDRGDVVLDTGPQRVRLRADADPDAMRAVMAVRWYLTQHHRAWLEIDGRFDGWVFVRKEPA